MVGGALHQPRLSLLVALIVTGVVTSVAYLEVRSFERDIDSDLVDAARLGAQSVADDLAARRRPLDPLDIGTCSTTWWRRTGARCDSVIEVDDTGQLGRHQHVHRGAAEVVDLAGRSRREESPSESRSDGALTFACRCPARATTRWR